MNVPSRVLAAVVLTAVAVSVVACGGGKSSTATSDLYATQTAQSSSASTTPASGATQASSTPAQTFGQACQKSTEKSWASAPPRIIDTKKTYTATITLAKGGDIVLELFSDVPVTTNNFVFLACKGFYDGLTFHRVLTGFMAQGGDPLGTGTGGPGYTIPDESDDGHNFSKPGAISMAKAGPNTTGSQFFITYSQQSRLDADFTVFGKVTKGMDVLEKITPRDPDQSPTFTGDAIATITISEK